MIFHVKNQCRYILFYGVGLSINFPIKLTIKFTIKFYRHVWVVGGGIFTPRKNWASIFTWWVFPYF